MRPADPPLARLLTERILVLDGAMGTWMQGHGLSEADYRGTRLADHAHDLRGNHDILCLTYPDVVRDAHDAHLRAGADILKTNTFTATSISQSDYGTQDFAFDINKAGAAIARAAADAQTEQTPDRPRFVAGSIGPTNRTASISPDVNDPGARNVTFDELAAAYGEAARGLIAGGVDALLIETVFDTLNCKAAIYGILQLFEAQGAVPLMISATITDRSGRTLSGQTASAFWHSVSHANPLSVGLNCALGARDLRQYVQEMGAAAWVPVSVHPNAGLPNAFGGYDDTPEQMAQEIGEFASSGLVNLVGGCCGTTPDHIAAIAGAVAGAAPRVVPERDRHCHLSGLEPLLFGEVTGFVNVGERTNVSGSARFAKLIRGNDFDAALDVARQQVAGGAQVIDVNMDDAMLDSEEAMETFLKLVASEPDISRVPVMIDSSKFSVIEAGLKCVQGRSVVNSISLKEGEAPFIEQARKVRRYGAAVVVMGVRRARPGRQPRPHGGDLHPVVPRAHRAGRDAARGHHLRSQHFSHRHRNRRAFEFLPRLLRRRHGDQAGAAARGGVRRREQRLVLVPRQQRRARGDARGVPLPRNRSRHGHGHRQRGSACRLHGNPR